MNPLEKDLVKLREKFGEILEEKGMKSTYGVSE